MAKTVIKELGIVILLLIAIGLILAILFYEYIPNNKTVPIEIQAYNVPEDIKQELQTATQEENIVRTYSIDSSDLDLYESTNDYDKGKANPFAEYTESGTTNSSENTSGNNNTNTANNNTQNNANKNEVYITTPGKNY